MKNINILKIKNQNLTKLNQLKQQLKNGQKKMLTKLNLLVMDIKQTIQFMNISNKLKIIMVLLKKLEIKSLQKLIMKKNMKHSKQKVLMIVKEKELNILKNISNLKVQKMGN